MKSLFRYLNPIAHLGERRYSVLFPLLTTILIAILLEVLFVSVLHNPNGVGLYAIFIFIALIVYFAFREGIRGGFIAAIITISYYFYIIYSRNYTGSQFRSGIETSFTLGLLYFLIAWIIGWLKQTIDTLIEREANERKRLQSVIQQLPVGVVITDSEGSVILGNKQVEVILGRKMNTSKTVGKDTISEATYNGKSVAASQWPLARTLATGKPVLPKEFIFAQQNGKKKYVNISASLIHNSVGNVIAAASIMQDMTHQKELDERKEDFVNMASHELKTPITSMKLYLDMLDTQTKTLKDKRVTRMVTGAKEQTVRLQSIVNDLLDVSRLQTGKLSFNKEVFNLTELVTKTSKEIKNTAKFHTIVLSKQPDMYVYADKFRIYQVLTNLMTNAIKYSPANTTVKVGLKREKGMIIFSIKDQGIGIEKEQQKKIFDRLYQVTESKEKTFPGLGMGLYIASEIVKKNNGEIWVESSKTKEQSAKSQGSTFYFTLPSAKKTK